jgi:acyl-CoA thioesterase FadM
MPSSYSFETVLEIRVGDLNYGKHLANDAVLTLVHEARLRHLASINYTEHDIEGLGLIQIDTAVVYKSQGFWGQKIRIQSHFEESGNIGLDFYYLLTNQETGKEIARAKTGLVFFDYSKQYVCPIPAKIRGLSKLGKG